MDETAAGPWLGMEIALMADRCEAVCALLEAAGALSLATVDAGDRPVLVTT